MPSNTPTNPSFDLPINPPLQLRSPPLEDAVDILKGLQAMGLSSIMSGLDNLRNMVRSTDKPIPRALALYIPLS